LVFHEKRPKNYGPLKWPYILDQNVLAWQGPARLRFCSLAAEPGAAGYEQTIKVMESTPLRQAFKEGRKAEYDELSTQLADLKCGGQRAA
jgi:hypothetical protein